MLAIMMRDNGHADVRAQGEYGHAASARGHEAVVQLLLEKNVDIHVQGGKYCNALQAASARSQCSHQAAPGEECGHQCAGRILWITAPHSRQCQLMVTRQSSGYS